MSRFASATVTQVSPRVLVAMDGDAAHPIPALSLYAATVGDRVRLEVRRSGLLPVIQGSI